MKVSDINKASIIILDHKFGHFVVDKTEHQILHTRQHDFIMCRDCTKECEKMESNYMIKDLFNRIPYKGGIVMSKLLNNRTDIRCINYIDIFDIKLQ